MNRPVISPSRPDRHRWIEAAPAGLGFATNTLDRMADKREDPAWLEDARHHPQTRTIVLAGDMPVLKRGELPLDPLFRFLDVPFATDIAEPVFLGSHQGELRFATLLPETVLEPLALRTDVKAIDLRSIAVQGLVTPANMNLIATAKALATWHVKHGFCANCGLKSGLASAGWKRICAGCSTEHFPRTDPVVIMMAVNGDHCLMGRSARFPPGMYSALAGFMEPGESIEDAVRREILEEAGIVCTSVAYHYSQPWPFPMSLMIGCLAQATSRDIKIDGNELEDARWFSKQEMQLILKDKHPEGIKAPTTMSIAHHLMRQFLEI